MNIKKLTFLKTLTNTFGIGNYTANKILNKIGLNKRSSPLSLNGKQKLLVNRHKKLLNTGKSLSTFIRESINFKQKIKSYRGIRHKRKYPVRGQRTHTNAKTTKTRSKL